MNTAAERHIVKAEGYLAKGDAWYRKAGEEIVAAQQADTTLSNREAARRLGKSETWVRRIVAFATTASPGTHDLWQRGSHATTAEIREGAERLLREAPLEQVEQMISELPEGRQQAIAAAAGDRFAQHRQRFEEEQDRPRTEAERRREEAEDASVRQHVARVAAPIQSMTIESLLEEATERLNGMVEERGVTPAVLEPITKALDAFITEFQVARAMAGLDSYERSALD